MEDNLNFLANGRQPQFIHKWQTTLTVWKMEDDLNLQENGRQCNLQKMEDNLNLQKMEDDLNIFANGRRPQYFSQCKTTSIFWKMEDNLKYLGYGIT